MSGIFGNSKEDRSMERALNRHLDSLEEPEMEDDIELTREEVEVFLSVVGNMPVRYTMLKHNDVDMPSLFETEREYDNLMKLYDRLHALVEA